MKIYSLNCFFAVMALSFITLPVAAENNTLFNSNLSESDKAIIASGKVLIKSVNSIKQLSLQSNSAIAQKAIATAKDLHPAYIAEIIQIRPYKGNENLLDNLEKLIIDIPSYVGIPYYSEHAESWYDLYSSAKILSQTKTSDGIHILADLEMEPFGTINTQIDTTKATDSFYYESMNLNKLRYYDKFTCVTPQKMKSIIIAFKDGDNWILYGIGAVNAPSIFFLRDRVETSFMNRIKTFCSYFFEKL